MSEVIYKTPTAGRAWPNVLFAVTSVSELKKGKYEDSASTTQLRNNLFYGVKK